VRLKRRLGEHGQQALQNRVERATVLIVKWRKPDSMLFCCEAWH
jgi:hypothetical protein